MQTNITFRNLEATEALKAFARDKVERVHKYIDSAREASKVRELLDAIVAQPESRSSAGPKVIRTEELPAKPMSVEEAVMQMDLIENDFLVFKNATSQEVNVVYRRKDGNYGLIEARSR